MKNQNTSIHHEVKSRMFRLNFRLTLLSTATRFNHVCLDECVHGIVLVKVLVLKVHFDLYGPFRLILFSIFHQAFPSSPYYAPPLQSYFYAKIEECIFIYGKPYDITQKTAPWQHKFICLWCLYEIG